MKKTIGLCMIVKDEVADVARIVKHYGKFFDCIYLTVTNKSKLEEFKTLPQVVDPSVRMIVSEFEWCGDFSKARNFNFAQADTDYVFWMDADDEIINPEGIAKLIENYPDINAFYMDYLYHHDQSGNCTMRHKRERIIKNSKLMTWKGRVHESLILESNVFLKTGIVKEVSIKHLATEERNVESHKRNVEILINEWNEHKDQTDPRTISYLAGELTALKRYKEAIKFYEKHIELSGWDEDKYLSWNKLAQNLIQMYLETKDNPELLTTAISALVEASLMFPEHPDAYLTIGECYLYLRQWQKAIEWTNTGLTKKVPENLPYYDPTRYSIRPLPVLAFSYLELDEVEKAYAMMKEAMNRAPNNPIIKDNFPFFEKCYNEIQLLKNFINIAKYLEVNDRTKLEKIADIIPQDMAGDDRFIQLRNSYKPAAVWTDNSVVIFCGNSCEEWAPPSTVKGIGGSEEAVIYLSKELTALGYSVTVFNNCGDMEGNYDGVEYKNYWNFNKNDMYNIIISWRVNIFKSSVNGRRKLVWMHDVPFKNEWSVEDYENLDKVIVLSNYHKTLFPGAPEDKIYVSTNGINVADFIETDKKEIHRNPHRIIYSSAHNRGLENLLDMWPDICKEDPLAELHVYYGWQTYDALNSDNQDMMRWKEQIIKKMQQPGIKDHGRVGHKKLLEEMAKSAIWAYPTFFPEINCITALKAQATGCFPVFHNLYALQDTCKQGWAVEEKDHEAMLVEYKDKLINALKVSRELSVDTQKIRDEYAWGNIAKDWSERLFDESFDNSVSDKNESVGSLCEVAASQQG